MPFSSPFSMAMLLALLIHLSVFIKLDSKQAMIQHDTQSVAVTFVNKASQKIAKKADFIAQQNQVGKAKKIIKNAQFLDALAVIPIETHKITPPPPRHTPAPQKRSSQSFITAKTAAQKIIIPEKSLKKQQKKIQLSMGKLMQQLDNLNKDIEFQKSKLPQKRIKPIQQVNAHQYVAAQYISDWKTKIERLGKLNYPNFKQRQGATNSLIMDVGINADGSLYSLHIRKSSGSSKLDEAAKRIVLLSTPFPPLPIELLKELDTLVITRIWNFTNKP